MFDVFNSELVSSQRDDMRTSAVLQEVAEQSG